MEWINLRYDEPEVSGPYLISLSIVDSNGNEYFYNYYAYFNIDTRLFYEYESVTGKIGNIIGEKIIGWLKGLTNYLG